MAKKKEPEDLRSKEIRILFTEGAYNRLLAQAEILDVPATTWCRAVVMEKVAAFEIAHANIPLQKALDEMTKLMKETSQMVDDQRK